MISQKTLEFLEAWIAKEEKRFWILEARRNLVRVSLHHGASSILHIFSREELRSAKIDVAYATVLQKSQELETYVRRIATGAYVGEKPRKP